MQPEVRLPRPFHRLATTTLSVRALWGFSRVDAELMSCFFMCHIAVVHRRRGRVRGRRRTRSPSNVTLWWVCTAYRTTSNTYQRQTMRLEIDPGRCRRLVQLIGRLACLWRHAVITEPSSQSCVTLDALGATCRNNGTVAPVMCSIGRPRDEMP